MRIYLDPEAALLHQWKIMRDSTMRGYTVQQVREMLAIRRRDSRLYIQPQKKYADIIVHFSRGSLYYRTRELTHLDARLFQAKHAPKIDLSGVLDVSQDGCRPGLRFVKGAYAGAQRDGLEIDGTIAHRHVSSRIVSGHIWRRSAIFAPTA